MNESNSTLKNTVLSFLALFMVLFSSTAAMAQTPSCACKGAIQVSLDEDCSAEITSLAILADNSTCGGSSTTVVTLMRTPTSGIIATGIGSADLEGGHLLIGKTIYGKVTTASGVNSCWTTIKIEDKQKPVIVCPADVTLTCYQTATYCPEVIENCSRYSIKITNETVQVNDCKATTGLPDNVLKVMTRTYEAIDESGNVSEPCTMTITVIGLPELRAPYIVAPANRLLSNGTALECDAPFARLANGNPSPEDIVVNGVRRLGTGVPYLLTWTPTITGAAAISGGAAANAVTISGGTAGGSNARVLGASLCYVSSATQRISFDWSAYMRNNAGIIANPINAPSAQFNNDEPVVSLNGVDTNLPLNVIGSSSASGADFVDVIKGDMICFKVYTMNRAFFTILDITNLRSDVPASFHSFYTPLFPNPDLNCNVIITYSDVKLPEIKCVTKIMRTWDIIEWSCRTGQRTEKILQMIEIVDSKAPVIVCPANMTVSTNGHTCEANFMLPPARVTDNCSATITVDVAYPGGFLNNSNGGIAKLPVGCHTVRYTAYDACHNSSTCSIQVVVEDITPPTTVCKQFTTIGLTNDGKAWVPASSFDNGSYDECELAKVLVKRMDPITCIPCKTPEFPGFTYLGDFGTGANKHYYYISKHRAAPGVAMRTAAALEGYVVAINTLAEDQWLFGKVGEWNLNEDYMIGLRDASRGGSYTWASNETSLYRNWDVGAPSYKSLPNSFPFVKVNNVSGRWNDFGSRSCDESELLYVVEITNPCGFSNFAPFCCSDIGSSQMVQVRAIDKAGNFNDCMVNATVQDKLPPTIVCPLNMTVNCESIFDLRNLRSSFGWPLVIDNCENPRVVTDSIINLNSCRIGTITRNFTATDAGGRTTRCTQIITVTNTDRRFKMTEDRWPDDLTLEGCSNPTDLEFTPAFTGRPDLITDNTCSLVGAEYKDHIFTFNNTNGDACFKILRDWTVIDWCQSFLSDGGGVEYVTWTHTQVIKIIDKGIPVITSSCAPKSVCTFDASCTDGYIELVATATDNCTQVLRHSYRIDAFNDGSFDTRFSKSGLSNTADASGRYPIGTHRIEWSFEDLCGNLTRCIQLFTVANCKAPTPFCLNGLATSLMPVDANGDGTIDGGMIEIWASDFDNKSSHPCGYPILFSFAPITVDAQGRPVVQRTLMLTCDDVGRVIVRLYVGVQTPTGTIVQDFCTTFLDVQDNLNSCPETRPVVKGNLNTESQEPVKDVTVLLDGSEKESLSTNEGMYLFDAVAQGENYIIIPNKNDDMMNGISTIDLVMIQRHILGVEKITSPYRLIAADVNKDAKVSAADLIDLRKVILGTQASFTNNKSWRFVDKAYTFQDPSFAFAEAFPEVYTITQLSAAMTVDFTAIKVGDINGDVEANANSTKAATRSNNALVLTTGNQTYTSNQNIVVPVTVVENAEVSGFQFTVEFDKDQFNLVAVNSTLPSITDYNFGLTNLSEGKVTMSYSTNKFISLAEGTEVFTLTLRAKRDGQLAEAMQIGSTITRAEAYTNNLEVMKVNFDVETRMANVTTLFQNTPNPFRSMTNITFELAEEGQARLTLVDVAGRLIKEINGTYPKGKNTIEINKNELGISGILYYTLDAKGFKGTKKMIVIE